MPRLQEDAEERPEAALHVGHEEIQRVQAQELQRKRRVTRRAPPDQAKLTAWFQVIGFNNHREHRNPTT